MLVVAWYIACAGSDLTPKEEQCGAILTNGDTGCDGSVVFVQEAEVSAGTICKISQCSADNNLDLVLEYQACLLAECSAGRGDTGLGARATCLAPRCL